MSLVLLLAQVELRRQHQRRISSARKLRRTGPNPSLPSFDIQGYPHPALPTCRSSQRHIGRLKVSRFLRTIILGRMWTGPTLPSLSFKGAPSLTLFQQVMLGWGAAIE